MTTSDRPRVFLDVDVDGEPAGRLVFELFSDQAPKTCENFRQLCAAEHHGMSYAKSPFHRVIDEFMVQGGDIANGDGTGVASIYSGEFEDENLEWRDMDAAGLLCSANRGRDTNGSQFFITLEPCSHLKGKHTIFGHVVSGQEILDKIAKVAVDDNDRPLRPVLVSRCGELVQKKKQNRITTEDSAVSNSRDRGRRRRSDSSDFDMSATPPPRPVQRHRRQSDNVIDEGLRGRPRQRSASHSPSLASQDSEEGDTALTEKHKRKRSPSPSRHKIAPTPSNDESSYEQRRRRSLPNQYAEDRAQRYRDDEDRYRPSPRRNDDRYAGRRDDRPRPRQNDRYRPRDRYTDFGRLGGGDGRLGSGDTSENDPPVKYKGRGSMKYREPGRL